jgi:predicted ester cyclase
LNAGVQTAPARVAGSSIHEAFLARWSPCAFDNTPITEEQLMGLLEAARWAPSGLNVQLWRFIYAMRGDAFWAPLVASLWPGNHVWAPEAAALVAVTTHTLFTPPGAPAPMANPSHAFDAGSAWAHLALQATMSGWSAHGPCTARHCRHRQARRRGPMARGTQGKGGAVTAPSAGRICVPRRLSGGRLNKGTNMTLQTQKAIVRRLVDEVQTGGEFAVLDELMDPAFVDHTPSPGVPPTRDGARPLCHAFRHAFPDIVATIEFQTGEGDLVTTRKTYKGSHKGEFLGVTATGRTVNFDVIDVLRVRDGRITDHWGVMNIASLMQQLTADLTAHRGPDRGASAARIAPSVGTL